MIWSLQDAKNNFSKVVQSARTHGAQMVTLRGERTAVVLSVEDYEKLTATRVSIVDHLLSGEPWDDELVEAISKRSKSLSRDVAF